MLLLKTNLARGVREFSAKELSKLLNFYHSITALKKYKEFFEFLLKLIKVLLELGTISTSQCIDP